MTDNPTMTIVKRSLFGCVLFAFTPLAFAFFVGPGLFPIQRLIATAERQLKNNPSSAEAHYLLARIHYLAFAYGTTAVYGGISKDGSVSLDEREIRGTSPTVDEARHLKASQMARAELGIPDGQNYYGMKFNEAYDRHFRELERKKWIPADGLPVREMLTHAEAVLVNLRAAQKSAPTEALYVLGEGCFAEQFTDWIVAREPTRVPTALRRIDLEQARLAYLRAFRIADEKEGKLTELPTESRETLVSYEAGKDFVRLTEARRGVAPGDETVASDLSAVKSALARLETLKFDGVVLVTPIVISLQTGATLAEQLRPGSKVDFDLRGYGVRHSWPWVSPKTGFLVWDPSGRGEITSGQQLFGGYTFQIFRKNGYEALAALDDDGDGVLRGAELRGIRVWFDANSDGISQPGEVRDLAELGIAGIAVRATGQEGPHPMNAAGIIFSDGRTLPTWDWMVAPEKN